VVLGLKSSCTLEASSGGVTASVSCNDSSLGGVADLKTVDVGLTGGLGVDVPLTSRFVMHPSIAYTRGLISIDNTNGNFNVMNSAFFIGLELRLKL
jgi:hypothetical protein